MYRVEKVLGQFLDLYNAERQYPLSKRKLNYLITNGDLRAYRADGKIIIRRDDLEAFLTARQIAVEPEGNSL